MIELTQSQIEQIVSHARAEAPQEACGLLAGKPPRVERVYPMKNVEESRVAYRLDPVEQYRVFTEINAAGSELIAIYHSHPHSEAYPSPTDVALAYYPELVYLIISLVDTSKPEVRAFRIQEGTIMEEQVSVIDHAEMF